MVLPGQAGAAKWRSEGGEATLGPIIESRHDEERCTTRSMREDAPRPKGIQLRPCARHREDEAARKGFEAAMERGVRGKQVGPGTQRSRLLNAPPSSSPSVAAPTPGQRRSCAG